MVRPLTDTETYSIANALRVAAIVYERDAVNVATAGPGGAGLYERFTAQAQAARAMADRLEQAEAVTLAGA